MSTKVPTTKCPPANSWIQQSDIRIVLQNEAEKEITVVLFFKNEGTAVAEDTYLVWKKYQISGPGSLNFVYKKCLGVGAEVTDEEEVSHAVGPYSCDCGSTWMFNMMSDSETGPSPKLVLEQDKMTPTQNKGGLIMVLNKQVDDIFTAHFGLYKLGAKIACQRNVEPGQKVYFVVPSVLYLALNSELSREEFITNIDSIGQYWRLDLKTFTVGVKIRLMHSPETEQFTFSAQRLI